MLHLNRVQLIGRLGEDPALRQVGDQKMVTLDMATTEVWRDAAGEPRENTVWHQIEFVGRLAEIVSAGGYHGARVLLEGALVTESMVDADGRNRRAALIKAKSMQFLDPRRAAEIKPAPATQDPAVLAQQTANAGRIPPDLDTNPVSEPEAPVAAPAAAATPAAAPSAAPVAAPPAAAAPAAPARRFVRPGTAPVQTQAPVAAPAAAPAAAPDAARAPAQATALTPPAAPSPAPAAPARRFVRPGTAAPVAAQVAAPANPPVAARAPAPVASAPAAAPAVAGAQPRRTWGRGINQAAAAANS